MKYDKAVSLFHTCWMILVILSCFLMVAGVWFFRKPQYLLYMSVPVWVQNISTWIWGKPTERISKTCPLSRLEVALHNNEPINKWWIFQPVVTFILVTLATMLAVHWLNNYANIP